MQVTLPDGTSVAVGDNATALDVAKTLGPGLAKAALAARVNGALVDLTMPLSENDSVEIITFDSPEGKSVFWHSSSHVLAQAVQELFPAAKLAIGPPIDEGFYYDFDMERPFTPDDLQRIEKACKEVAARKTPLVRKELSRQEAQELFRAKSESYKLELLEDIEGNPTVYQQGEWLDLCRGPHIPHTGYLKAIKILNSAGAYWRGDERNKMLQRIYAVSFPKQAMLDEHLALLEEAQKRNHRRIGKQLGLFSFHAEAAGFPFWHPKGMVLYNEIIDYCRQAHLDGGYHELQTPAILNEELWHRSGHWDKFRENMYFTQIDDVTHAIKPMNCPGGLLVYKNEAHSYREFPIKNFEFGLVHRHEKAAVLNGLFRVRAFMQDDAHIFCLPDQIETQISEVFDFVVAIYRTFGFSDYHVELSTRPEEHIGTVEVWDKSEKALQDILDKKKVDYRLNPGEGAFYGPKIDFHIRDSLKRNWQCGTIQLDFSMPERFELEYTDRDGTKKRPVMIHRALLGSMERFIAILIEHYGGSLPLWLSPVQLEIVPVSEKSFEYADGLEARCREAQLRTHVDRRANKVGYKIRDAEIHRVPYMAVVGEKEQVAESVSLRRHGQGDLGTLQAAEAIDRLVAQIRDKT